MFLPCRQSWISNCKGYSDGYRIQRIRKAKESNTDELNAYRYDADWIYLEDDNNGGYNIFCSTSADTPLDIQSDGDEPVCREDETAVFVQNIQAGDTAVLPSKRRDSTEHSWISRYPHR